MNRRLSVTERISSINFLAMWMVVIIHFSFIGSGKLSVVVTQVLTQWAVPWFFLVSGIFAHESLRKQTARVFVAKKFRGLIVPYFAWCLIPAGFALAFGYRGTMLEVLGITTQFPVCNTVLWYLRSLIGFMAVILLWHKILIPIRGGRFFVALMFVVTLCCLARVGVDLRGTPASLFYFIAGYLLSDLVMTGSVANYHVNIIVLSIAWVIVGALRISWFAFHLHGSAEMVLRNVCVVAMICAIWISFGRFEFLNMPMPGWTRGTFLVYCMHGVILKSMAPLLSPVVRSSLLVSIISYVLYALVAPLFFFLLIAMFRKTMPRMYALLSGGR